ncbi:trithorax group protein osa isoform X2 [Sitophilus oryzae]|uniref:Trithorax group protein osa isoform X2 n=1 Tax=Sitophilus oryzae TaxID=7048 RepID=A0A6J2XY81_SITOR|nr:trithorax group protein osa isoform X2 [Sitophilus oryzae]
MSQYRQDGGGGSSVPGAAAQGSSTAGTGPNGSSEGESEPTAGPGSAALPPDSNAYSTEGPTAGPPSDGHGYAFPYGSAGPDHAFGPRQSFGGPKQLPPPHRFVPGPMSQPSGPTPTLNQLLQSNNPVPLRYQNNYAHSDQHYNQWSQKHPQGYGPAPPPGPYRTQQTLSPAYGSAPSPGGYDSRATWPGGPPPSGLSPHGPSSPGQGQAPQQQQSQPPNQQSSAQSQQNSSGPVPVSQPSPQPSQPPVSHSPGPGPGPGQMPPGQHQQQHQGPGAHQQGFPSRPPPPTTPNAHAPDAADLSGGNSNDSSGGPAPGTPNSQGMRPTPSPTGSTGSRSMSPAVGQNIPMPPRPSSSQSDGGGASGGGGGIPARLSHSPMPPGPGSYGPPGQQSQHQAPYKGVVPGPGGGTQNSSQIPIYQHQPGQYPGQAVGYSPRPPGNFGPAGQGYVPSGSQPPTSNSMPPQQFPGRPGPPNHMQNSQFSPYQQPWPSSPSPSQKSNTAGGPNGQNPSGPQGPGCPSPGPNLRPPHYLKHHLQHKMGFAGVGPGSAPPSPGPPQNFHMGPPSGHHHSGMGPPPSMGPPNMPPSSSPMLTNNHPHEGPMPPPSSTPNSHSQMVNDMLDNGITTTPQGSINTHVSAASGGSVTSVVTTGPDGTPIDEGSQQSTLSNASAASGEDPACPQTPKSNRKNDMGHYGHPTTPQNTVPSPGASMNSMHDDYGDISPTWPRTPASPVFNSHVPPQDTYRSKKTDSLSKLYEMDESPDRRAWLDKLLAFMDDRRTPITTCPTISKNPLDLFRLYVYVKDRGGFMEVTKNKTWKDIAGLLGIGASSSAAYTLRKHYTKNLLAYECQFDRGGIDPQPIINQVEASSKKKSSKNASVPSPGSSNSQDSFPPGGGGGSMDGYGGYNGYPPSGNPDYPQRPSSQSAPSPHGAPGSANHLNSTASGGPSPAGGAADNVSVSNPFDDVSPSPPPRGGPFPSGPHPPYPTNNPPRPPGSQNYSNQPGYQYSTGSGQNAPPDQYSPYSNTQGYQPAVRPMYPPYSGDSSGAPPGQPSSGQPPSSGSQDPYNRYNVNPAAGYTPRPPYGGSQPSGGPPSSQPSGPGAYPGHQDYYRPDQNSASGGYPGVSSPNKNMPPPGPQPPRRHPDFAKDQPYPPYGQPRTPMYGGWTNNNNQYRPPQYGTPGSNQVAPQQWNQGARPGGGPWPNNQGYQGSQPGQNQWQPMTTQTGQSSPMRPVHRPGKPFPPIMPPGNAAKGPNQPPVSNSYGHGQLPKREITFPPDSVENVTPVLYRRKKVCRQDLGPVDAWRLIMCLRSGLLTEGTYALDMLNILLYDDTSVGYFSVNQWPGLLDLLLEQFKKNLSDMFDGPYPKEYNADEQTEVDLGSVTSPIDPSSKTVVFNKTTNYTLMSRRGHPVKFVERNDDIFVQDTLRDWDIRGDVNIANTSAEIPADPWYTSTEHILPNFQAEFGRIPFHTRLEEKNSKSETVVKDESKRQATSLIEDVSPPKVSDKKRCRTKTLSDVISRIKKESPEDNAVSVLMMESNTKLDNVKTEVVSETSLNCEESASSSVDLNISVNGECSNSTENSGDIKRVKGQPIHDPAGSLKRRRLSDYEDESYSRDEASLVLLTESQDNLGKRCVCISNILRSLTFIPGNEPEFAKSYSFLALVGKLLLLHHEHPPRTQKTRNYDREIFSLQEDADFADSCSSLQGEHEWWWEFLAQVRENILVCISNIAGQIDVSVYGEEVARPLLDGLLHWAICPSATAQDPFSSIGPTSLLSPQRLALEALCKLCVTNSNVDLVIATPPFSRLEKLCAVLTKHLCRSEDQVLREFSINLLHYLAAADSSMARVVAAQTPCVSLLVAFIEQAEQSALEVANQRGISALRDNPDSMGTSLDMLRRAAATLVFLSKHPENKALLVQQESRLLALVMSQILDQQVALLISKVLFQISRS